MPGEIGSRPWPLFVPSLGGKVPFSVGWLADEFLGKLAEGTAPGAVQIFDRIVEEHICVKYQLKAVDYEKERHH